MKVVLVALIGTMITVGVYGCKNSEEYYNRGMARFEKGENDRAISDFTNAIKKNPRYGMAYYYRAMAYHRKKEYDQVISDYTKAIEIDPQRFAVAYAERAFIYYVKKNMTKRGRMSIRQRVWGWKFGRNFSRPFVKPQEEKSELG